MIRGIGVDIAENQRFEHLEDNFLKYIFTENELQEAEKRRLKSEFFASRFAAKEAFAKALGTGFIGFSPKDIEVAENEAGAPFFLFSEKLKGRVEGFHILLSLSHEKAYSVAMVVME